MAELEAQIGREKSELKSYDNFKLNPDFRVLDLLPGHVEFLSDGWLEESRQFLDSQVEKRKVALGEKPFSVSWRFTDAPPHLGFDGNVASWSMHFDGEKASVSRAFDQTADLLSTGNYQAALCVAQVIGAAAPGRMKRAHEQAAAMVGYGKFTCSGTLGEAEAALLMAEFHDHMGRMTVENPDLVHRAEQFGVTDKIRFLEENGYVVLENVLPDSMVQEARERALEMISYNSGFAWRQLINVAQIFEDILVNPKLLTLVDATLNRGAILCGTSCNIRGPGESTVGPHTDYYGTVPEPYPADYSLSAIAFWALDDWTEATGPTWLAPKSHRKRREPRPDEDAKKGGIPIEMPAGSVVLFGQAIWHWQGDRTEPGQRVSILCHLIRHWMRPFDQFEVDSHLLRRHPPRMAELVGDHDFMGKTQYQPYLGRIDRDLRRGGYMQNLRMRNEEAKQRILVQQHG